MARGLSILIASAASVSGALYFALAHRRFVTFHNGTFDLALYGRMAWGLVHGDFWEPVVGAAFAGVHLSFVMFPLGLVGLLFRYPETLLAAQAIAVALAVWPLAQIGQRHLGTAGALGAAFLWLLYPNVAHVATDEFHPGTLAVLPLALLLEAIDRGTPRSVLAWSVVLIACREDLALTVVMAAGLWAIVHPDHRRTAARLALGAGAYFLLFVFVLLPLFGPKEGSADLHFAQWGGSFGGILTALFTRPGEVMAYAFEAHRRHYLLLLFLPTGLLPFANPRWLLPLAPALAVNLLSAWPTASALDSHYQTIMVPTLVVATVLGAERASNLLAGWKIFGTARPLLVFAAALTLVAHARFGGTPLSADWDPAPFEADARSGAARRVVDQIPEGVSIQAPYALMPHLVERSYLRKPPPPDYNTDYVILDGWHRERFRGKEDLLRSAEEPVFRHWLGRDDYGLVAVEEPYFVLAKGTPPRASAGRRFLRGTAFADDGVALTACLAVRHAQLHADRVDLTLVARGPCPQDLAIRIGSVWVPERVDLLFDGQLMPNHLRWGDLLVSSHELSPAERARIETDGLRVGALRTSGARPSPEDPPSVHVPFVRPSPEERTP
ncbi:MAG: DUF2079 domain-containing protein [Myxococcales bacterium]|nr:DUF2079 domain-containing protein [Myxococcales bacterium]